MTESAWKPGLQRSILPQRQDAACAEAVLPALADALRAARRLRSASRACTLSYAAAPSEPPARVGAVLMQSARALAGWGQGGCLSVDSVALQHEAHWLRPAALLAARQGHWLQFDAQEAAGVEATLAMMRQLQPTGAALGLTVPARWRRSGADLAVAMAQGWRVRLVKGRRADPARGDQDARAGFLALVEQLADGLCTVALATHDLPLLREALCRLHSRGLPCEIEFLDGMPPRQIVALAQEMRVPLRGCVRFGPGARRGPVERLPEAFGIRQFAREAFLALRPG